MISTLWLISACICAVALIGIVIRKAGSVE